MKINLLTAVILAAVLLIINSAAAQVRPEDYKIQAQKQMQFGRYGEAIDLLNKYIAARPQQADGYNLRGLCYEAREQYEYAVYDFRSARKLAPSNKDINNNLARTTKKWYSLLYNDIEGYKREIAINPSIAENYLKIGKAYKNLGKWGLAEEWYDKYLKMADASPDEIIRYSEILAKNNHIKKGEPILKRYTERFPDDHRLWSRYGYFELWLGKNKNAINAFENALALRPYFKEAMDGLDQARGKGYIYTVNDTSARYNYGLPIAVKGKVYPIDRYYRILKTHPDDNDTRYKLVKALIDADRYQEAYDQLQVLQESDSTNIDLYQEYWAVVRAKRDSLNAIKLANDWAKYKADPNDKNVAMRLAEAYARATDYDSALVILNNYLDKASGPNLDVRYKIAQYAAWNYQFNDAIDQLNYLLEHEPDNLDYQLLRAQIAVWTVQDFDLAEPYFKNVIAHRPHDINALLGLASLYSWKKDFADAKNYLDKAKEINPRSKLVESVQSFYDRSVSGAAEMKIMRIREEAGKLAQAGHCEKALDKYEEYFSKITAPDKQSLIEYADVNICAKNYDKAIGIYDNLLNEEYDPNIALMRAKAYIWAKDSVQALNELQKLVKEDPRDFDTKFYLAEAYELNHDYDKARDIYDNLLEETRDTSQIKLVKQRINWLPVTGVSGILATFPNHIGLAPQAGFYADNQNLRFNTLGGRAEFGITSFLSVGASVLRTHFNTLFGTRDITTFEWQLYFNLSQNLYASLGLGTVSTIGSNRRNISDATVRYQVGDKLSLTGTYQNTDARLVLYSPALVNIAYDANIFRFRGSYLSNTGLKVSGMFGYLTLSDGNSGNDLQLRIGKEFYKDLFIGYEYYFTDYSWKSFIYYSPQNFDSHSLWAEWIAEKTSELSLNFGGKLGYIPYGDFIIREGYGEVKYQPITNFILSAKLSVGSSYRFDSSYNYVSGIISAYWSFF